MLEMCFSFIALKSKEACLLESDRERPGWTQLETHHWTQGRHKGSARGQHSRGHWRKVTRGRLKVGPYTWSDARDGLHTNLGMDFWDKWCTVQARHRGTQSKNYWKGETANSTTGRCVDDLNIGSIRPEYKTSVQNYSQKITFTKARMDVE